MLNNQHSEWFRSQEYYLCPDYAIRHLSFSLYPFAFPGSSFGVGLHPRPSRCKLFVL